MLYSYSSDAYLENWLHEALIHAIKTAYALNLAGSGLPAWPELFPNAHQDALRIRPGLESRVDTFLGALGALGFADQALILSALDDQNKIRSLLDAGTECTSVHDLPGPIREPAVSLFSFAFDLLTDLGLRDLHYRVIWDGAEVAVCPFCGSEVLDPPNAPREDLDHYLVRTRYPFAAANLENLVPMGRKCNTQYKKSKDVLWTDDGERSQAFYPWEHPRVTITLDNTHSPLPPADRPYPEWIVSIVPSSPAAETWDRIFEVRTRVVRDVLEVNVPRWLGDFRNYCRRFIGDAEPTAEAAIQALECWGELLESMGLRDQAFLKVQVFRQLHKHSLGGPYSYRVRELLTDLAAHG